MPEINTRRGPSRRVYRIWSLVFASLFVISLAAPMRVSAAPMTFLFSGEVSDLFALGPPTIDDEFSVGELVAMELTYDVDAPENAGTIADPDRGIYEDPTIEFTIDFVDSERVFDATGGAFQVIEVLNDFSGPGFVLDSVGTSAQTSVGGTISGTLDGQAVTIVSLSLGALEFGMANPEMIQDGMLPDAPFEPQSAQIILSTVPGESVTVTVDLTVPEPSMTLGLALGFLGIGGLSRRRV